MNGNDLGLGGQMKSSHAKALLHRYGKSILTAVVRETPGFAQAQVRGGRVLRKRDISSLSYRECVPWLLAIGRTIGNTRDKRRKALEEHFEGHPEDYELKLGKPKQG